MFFRSIKIKNFLSKKIKSKSNFVLISLLNKLIKSENQILLSMQKNYKVSYNKKLISNLKKYKNVNIIGMGGSVLGSKAIYSFLELKKKISILLIVFQNFLSKIIKKKN